ncbi:restriction endonuclease subunit S [uncultured Ruegeria sp.]|uniref:restriction endonuclease subunit S n=1 Tax=uncultured Ruegeria sp. TaxID=259304 RepID=UPI00262D69BA|nr:restriction endonuclease subunit S [uncultured Ruegeria sp.]
MKKKTTGCWPEMSLDEVALVGAGNPAPQNKELFEKGVFPFIRTADVGAVRFGEISTAADLLNEEGIKKLRLVPKGTVLMPKSGASTFLNHRVLTLTDAYVSSHLATISAKEGLALPRFLLHALSRVKAQELLPKNSYPSLNLSLIKSIKLPIPPIEEQRRIVAFLDGAFEGLKRARENAEANLQNARELLLLSFENELIASEDQSKLTTIGEVCSGFEYGTSAKSKTSGMVPVLRMGNLQSGEIDWGNLVYTDNAADIEKLNLKKGDVLFNRTNSLEHVGKAAIYRGETQAIFAGYLIRLHFDREKLLPEFLNMFLNSKGARKYGRLISGKSVNQANISASKLKTYPMHLPSLDVQKKIVGKAEKMRGPIEDVAAHYETQLSDFDNLRQSLLQKAFAGELT